MEPALAAFAHPVVFDDPSLPTRYEIAAGMAAHLWLAAERDGFDLGDERCIHACLDEAGFDPVDVDDADLIDDAIERVRRCRIDVRAFDIATVG